MRNVVFVLVCISCAGQGRRGDLASERLQGVSTEFDWTSDKASVAPLNTGSLAVLGYLLSSVQLGAPSLPKTLATLFVAVNEPLAAWQTSTSTCQLGLNHLFGDRIASPVSTPARTKASPSMKKKSGLNPENIVAALEERARLRRLKKEEDLLRKEEELLAGARAPETVEELYALLVNKVGAAEAQKIIATRAMQVAQKRVDVKPGMPLPLPIDISKLQCAQGDLYASVDEVINGKSHAVVIAARERELPEKLRSIFLEFEKAANKLDLAVIGLTGASIRMLSKFVRKRKVSIPLFADPEGEWLSPLNVLEGTKNKLIFFVIDSRTKSVISLLDGTGKIEIPLMVESIAAAIKNPPLPPSQPAIKESSAIQEDRPATELTSNTPAPSTSLPPPAKSAPLTTDTIAPAPSPDPGFTAKDWEWAAAPDYTKPITPKREPSLDKEDFDWAKTSALPEPAPIRPSATRKPAVKPPTSPAPSAPVAPQAPAKAGLTELEKENLKLKQALEEAKRSEEASRIEAENAALKAALKESQATKIANEAAVKAQAQAEAAMAAAQRQRRATEADLAKKADTQRKKLRMEKEAAEKTAAAVQAEKAKLLAQVEAAKEAAMAEAEKEKAALQAQLQRVQRAALAEAAARKEAEEKAKYEHDQAVAAGQAAQEAAEAAAKAAAAAAELAAKQASATTAPKDQRQPERQERRVQYMLPGVFRFMKLLNGTAGIKSVNASMVQSRPTRNAVNAIGANSRYGIVQKAGGSTGAGSSQGTLPGAGIMDQLFIKYAGLGYFGSHRLIASFENSRGYRSQVMYVSCAEGFARDQLIELLKALQPVLNFEFDDGSSGTRQSNVTLAEELLKDIGSVAKSP